MKSNNERNWYQDSIKDDKIKEYLKYILAYQKEQLEWYQSKKGKRRTYSSILLNIAIFFFAASLIFPLIPGVLITDLKQDGLGVYYAWGYIFLITTTIILLGDRLFGHSNGWIRYTLAYLQIDSVSSEFHGKWVEILPQLEAESVSDEARIAAVQLLQKFDTSLKNIVKSETENWRDIFSTQLQEFSQRADSKLNDVKQEISDFKETAQKNITKFEKVHLKIEFKNIPKGKFIQSKIFINANKPESKKLSSNDSTWVLMDLAIGEYMFDYVLESEDKKVAISKNDILSIGGEVKVKKIEINLNNAENKVESDNAS